LNYQARDGTDLEALLGSCSLLFGETLPSEGLFSKRREGREEMLKGGGMESAFIDRELPEDACTVPLTLEIIRSSPYLLIFTKLTLQIDHEGADLRD
jgi:hypothetical protein